MPDAPMTFMNEVDGEVFNVTSETIFQHRQAKEAEPTGIKRTNSRILMALTGERLEEKSPRAADQKMPKV